MRKIVVSFLSLFLGVIVFAGCRAIPPPAGEIIPSSSSSSTSSTPPTSSQGLNLTSVAINPAASAAAAVGFSTSSGQGTILVSSGGIGSCGSGSGHFPCGTWKSPLSLPSSLLPLTSVAFDSSSTINSYGLAVGASDTMLATTEPATSWSTVTPSFTCSTNTPVSLTGTSFSGVSIFGAQVDQNPAIIVGGPYSDSCSAANATTGLIAVTTTQSFPYSQWEVIDQYSANGSLQQIPDANFTGASFAQGGTTSNYALVVGYNQSTGYIFQGDTETGLANDSTVSNNSWSLSDSVSGAQFNGVALSAFSGAGSGAVVVGNNGVIYMNPEVGSPTSTWTQVPINDLPTQAQTANFMGVHFSSGSSTSVVVVGNNGANSPIILFITNCCNTNNITSSNIIDETPSITNLTGLFGIWGEGNGTTLAAGNNGFILENDNGGNSSTTPWFQVNPAQ